MKKLMKRYSRALAITGAGFSGPVSMAGAGRTTILLQRMALIVLLILTAAACGNKKSARKTDDNAFNTSSLRISGDGEQRISHPLVADDFIFKTVQQIDSTEFEGKKIRFDWQFTYCDNDFGGEPIDACLTNFCYTAFDKLFFNGFSNTTVDGIIKNSLTYARKNALLALHDSAGIKKDFRTLLYKRMKVEDIRNNVLVVSVSNFTDVFGESETRDYFYFDLLNEKELASDEAEAVFVEYREANPKYTEEIHVYFYGYSCRFFAKADELEVSCGALLDDIPNYYDIKDLKGKFQKPEKQKPQHFDFLTSDGDFEEGSEYHENQKLWYENWFKKHFSVNFNLQMSYEFAANEGKDKPYHMIIRGKNIQQLYHYVNGEAGFDGYAERIDFRLAPNLEAVYCPDTHILWHDSIHNPKLNFIVNDYGGQSGEE